jgi:hypothetical protein
MDSKIMGKIGFNCLLSEIGLATDSSHSTCFHKRKSVRFSLHEEDFVQHVLFDTGRRRTQFGIVKNRGEAEPSQDDTDHPSSCAKDLTISEGTGATFLFHFHSRVPFLCVSTQMDKFLFLGTHTRFVTTKRIMVTPPLTTSFSFINLIVIEIHVLPRQNL